MAGFTKKFVYMIFDFTLDPIENVHPWGKPENLNIGWFVLTQGNYRLKVGDEYLLNYTDEFVKYLSEKYPEYAQPQNTFVDYYIVRLWEDILEILPAILEPVPQQLEHFLDSGYENYQALNERAPDWQEFEMEKGADKNETWKVVDLATDWINNRWLDSAYLSPSARIWIWSDENDVVVSWENRQIIIEGISVWSASQGNYRINKGDFVNEIQDFDRKLFAEMNKRVEEVCRSWKNPEIKIDFEQLQSEQKNRAMWLESKLKDFRKTDWNEVISAIELINSQTRF